MEHSLSVNERTIAAKEGQKLDDQQEIFRGELQPGTHTLSATLAWEGEGGFLFTYLREYAFVVDESQDLRAKPGETIRVRVVGYQQGDFFTDMLDQPAVRLEIERD